MLLNALILRRLATFLVVSRSETDHHQVAPMSRGELSSCSCRNDGKEEKEEEGGIKPPLHGQDSVLQRMD